VGHRSSMTARAPPVPTIRPVRGVCAALLIRHGIKVFSERFHLEQRRPFSCRPGWPIQDAGADRNADGTSATVRVRPRVGRSAPDNGRLRPTEFGVALLPFAATTKPRTGNHKAAAKTPINPIGPSTGWRRCGRSRLHHCCSQPRVRHRSSGELCQFHCKVNETRGEHQVGPHPPYIRRVVQDMTQLRRKQQHERQSKGNHIYLGPDAKSNDEGDEGQEPDPSHQPGHALIAHDAALPRCGLALRMNGATPMVEIPIARLVVRFSRSEELFLLTLTGCRAVGRSGSRLSQSTARVFAWVNRPPRSSALRDHRPHGQVDYPPTRGRGPQRDRASTIVG
jgi:hypothetical protein